MHYTTTPQKTTTQLQASHYSGCGNTFLLFDNRQNTLPEFSAEFICTLCKTHGVDGLIIVCQSSCADCAMRLYNADGHEAEMCGNGVRCLMQYLRQKCAYPRERLMLQTMKKELVVTTDGLEITLELGSVQELGYNIALSHNKIPYCIQYLNIGVPHLVIFVDDIETIDVQKIGRYFRRHKRFQPNGVNVNFVEKRQDCHLIRTYERGVEKETLACGTGACAAGFALAKLYSAASPITFQVRSKELLTVSFQQNGDAIEHLELSGPANWISDVEVFIHVDSCVSRVT